MTEEEFIAEELASFATYLTGVLRERLVRMHVRHTDALLESVATATAQNELSLLFNDSGRFQDMGARRGWHKGKFIGAEERAAYLKPPKPRKWYGPAAYGSVFGTLAENLSNKYVAEVTERMVKAFDEAAR